MRGIIIAVVLVFGIKQTNAQNFFHKLTENVTGGFKGEVNVSNFLLAGMPASKSSLNIGGAIGGFMLKKVSEHFVIEQEFMLNYKTSDFEHEDIKGRYHYLGLEIPIYYCGQWTITGKDRFYVGAGTSSGIGFSAKYKNSSNDINLYKKDGSIKDQIALKRLTMGVAAIIGYEFASGFQLSANYKYDLINGLEDNDANEAIHQNAICLGLAYRFK